MENNLFNTTCNLHRLIPEISHPTFPICLSTVVLTVAGCDFQDRIGLSIKGNGAQLERRYLLEPNRKRVEVACAICAQCGPACDGIQGHSPWPP